MSSREFNQNTAAAKRAAEEGPVIITDRGVPRHVLTTYEDYEAGHERRVSLLEALGGGPRGVGDIEIDFEADRKDEDGRKKPYEFRPLDLD